MSSWSLFQDYFYTPNSELQQYYTVKNVNLGQSSRKMDAEGAVEERQEDV